MNKSAIKTFAIESRNKLMDEIKHKANLLGITANGIDEPVKTAEGMEIYDIGGGIPYTIYDKEIEQRKDLVRQVNEKGFDNVVEEVAYTWFNRIIAIRFMEVNDYLPTRVRVLSSENEGKIEPDIVTEAPNFDLDFSEQETEKIYQLKNENKLDELFRLLFIKQCNKLNEVLPELFEKTADYTELLLSISFTNEEGFIRQLIDKITEGDFTDQVEIIGWLYQYYNTELKDDTFKKLKNRVKVTKERLPAVTQLFTPDWIVRYMVENSLGRLWLEGHPDSPIKENWKYYLDECKQEPEVELELAKIRENSKNLKPEDIKLIDPAMGSGHILVYAFDVLMQIYTSMGYSEKDAAVSILENNLYGLDIDDRAYQLAYFAVIMKARSYNRRILTKNIELNLCSIQESNGLSDDLIDFVANRDLEDKRDLIYLKNTFKDAKELGSVINLKRLNLNSIINYLIEIKNSKYTDFNSIKYQNECDLLYPILKQANILSMKYDIVITNPPYMGNRGMNSKLSSYLKNYFPDSKNDLFAVFIERCLSMVNKERYLAMITQHVFMFLPSYAKLRKKVLESQIINMSHLGARAFEEIGGEVVQTTSFSIQNSFINDYKSTYLDLTDFNSQKTKERAFLNKNNTYIAKQDEFKNIPGSPVIYWAGPNVINNFKKGMSIDNISDFTGSQNKTANNNKYLRMHWEVEKDKIDAKKWVLYAKGGLYKKYYGNLDIVVNWSDEARDFYKTNSTSNLLNEEYWYKEGITYTDLATKGTGFRYLPKDCVFDMSGPSIINVENLYYCIGFFNSNVAAMYLRMMNPTLHIKVNNVKSVPLIFDGRYTNIIEELAFRNVEISRENWDSFENSIDFKKHPFLMHKSKNLEDIFKKWVEFTKNHFIELKNNEEKINEIFIEIYNLKEELNPEIKDSDVTISIANLSKDIKSFISYFVGCIFGRYSLDEEGLIYAGGQWDPSKYIKFQSDEDNIIPILDAEYFEDDIVGRFVEFVKITFGEDKLEENLDFIASALKKKGNTSREVIRNYFLNDFYKDHLKTYKKFPIYWQFDSGKDNGFKALIYMHRYEPDLVARVRTDYLHETQKALETARDHKERVIGNSSSASEKSKALKARDKLIKQLEETRKYDKALAHVANQRIEIDLDDGVKVNYAKFQGVEVVSEGKAAKIDLLKKI